MRLQVTGWSFAAATQAGPLSSSKTQAATLVQRAGSHTRLHAPSVVRSPPAAPPPACTAQRPEYQAGGHAHGRRPKSGGARVKRTRMPRPLSVSLPLVQTGALAAAPAAIVDDALDDACIQCCSQLQHPTQSVSHCAAADGTRTRGRTSRLGRRAAPPRSQTNSSPRHLAALAAHAGPPGAAPAQPATERLLGASPKPPK